MQAAMILHGGKVLVCRLLCWTQSITLCICPATCGAAVTSMKTDGDNAPCMGFTGVQSHASGCSMLLPLLALQ